VQDIEFSSIMFNGQINLEGTDLGKKVTISKQKSGKHSVTIVEGIPAQYSLDKLLTKLKSKDVLSCGGHVDKKRQFFVLHGSFAVAVQDFLVQEGVADREGILIRGM
jgi:translation initiation factor 1 (eIF-1/SUI1)